MKAHLALVLLLLSGTCLSQIEVLKKQEWKLFKPPGINRGQPLLHYLQTPEDPIPEPVADTVYMFGFLKYYSIGTFWNSWHYRMKDSYPALMKEVNYWMDDIPLPVGEDHLLKLIDNYRARGRLHPKYGVVTVLEDPSYLYDKAELAHSMLGDRVVCILVIKEVEEPY